MFEAAAYFMVCAFFFWVSKYWQYVMIPTIVLAIIGSTVTAIYIPESPRFLISQGKFDQARKVFSIIYSYNFNKNKTNRRSYVPGESGTPGFSDIVFQEEIDQISNRDRE